MPTHVLDRFRLDGRVALVTGGARGLGQTIATALAQVGADVALAGRDRAACDQTASEIAQATGRRVQGFSADVTKSADIDRLAADVQAALGPVDILVNNAGVNRRGPIQDLTEADWDLVIDTNLKGPWLCARALGPAMVSRGWGRIINLGSVMGFISLPGRTPYATSKAGIINMTRTLALEWAGTGVTANAICPGIFGTDMNKPLMDDPAKYKEFISIVPMGRWGELHELAGAAVFLASDASSYMTGTTMTIDGGWTAR